MKSAGLIATQILVSFVQIIIGLQNGLVNSQNLDTNSFVQQWLPPHTMANGNAGVLSSSGNHQQTQINTLPPMPAAQQIQPPDLKEQIPQLQLLLQQQQQQQPLMLQQPLSMQSTLRTDQPPQLQQTVQALQQPLGLQQNTQISALQQNLDFAQPAALQQQNKYQTPLNPLLNSQLPNPEPSINVGRSPNPANLNIQPQQNLMLNHPEVVNQPQLFPDKLQEVSAIRYQVAPQQSPSSFSLNTPVISNSPSIALIPSYSIKPMDQPYTSPYKYTKSSPEVQPAIIEKTQGPNPVSALPPILTFPSVPVQNTQTYYYNQQPGDPRQNVYLSQKQGFLYPQQSQIPVTVLQNQPTALLPRQTSVISSVPLSVIQTAIPQYGVSSSYPIATTAYQRSKSSNLKSFLPLIFNLLKDRIASCGCRNGCPCKCNSQTDNKEPEVLTGYSSMKHYGPLNEDAFRVLNNVSEGCEGVGCLRQRKNCVKKTAPEISDEIEEEEESDEEDVEEEDEED